MKLFNRTAAPNGSGIAREICELPDDEATTVLVVAQVRKRFDSDGGRDPIAEIELGELICEAEALKATNAKLLKALESLLVLLKGANYGHEEVRDARAAIADAKGEPDELDKRTD